MKKLARIRMTEEEARWLFTTTPEGFGAMTTDYWSDLRRATEDLIRYRRKLNGLRDAGVETK